MILCVSKNLGLALTPPAVRAHRPGWRDPRLWVGVAIVAASVLLGAKLLAEADDSVRVWAVSSDMGSGDVVGSPDLVARDVRFVQPADADRYLSADLPVPDGARLVRDVGAGELLPRSAVGTRSETTQRTVTFEFQGAGVPAGLEQGELVDVYVTSVADEGADRSSPVARLVLEGLIVTDLARAEDSLAGSGGREVTVEIPAASAQAALAQVVQAAKTDNVYLIRNG